MLGDSAVTSISKCCSRSRMRSSCLEAGDAVVVNEFARRPEQAVRLTQKSPRGLLRKANNVLIGGIGIGRIQRPLQIRPSNSAMFLEARCPVGTVHDPL